MIWRSSNFHQMHPVIKDNNSFQSLLGFPNLNPNSDMASFNLIKLSPILFIFHKDCLQISNMYILPVQNRILISD